MNPEASETSKAASPGASGPWDKAAGLGFGERATEEKRHTGDKKARPRVKGAGQTLITVREA